MTVTNIMPSATSLLNKEKVWMEAYTSDIYIEIFLHINIYYEKTLGL